MPRVARRRRCTLWPRGPTDFVYINFSWFFFLVLFSSTARTSFKWPEACVFFFFTDSKGRQDISRSKEKWIYNLRPYTGFLKNTISNQVWRTCFVLCTHMILIIFSLGLAWQPNKSKALLLTILHFERIYYCKVNDIKDYGSCAESSHHTNLQKSTTTAIYNKILKIISTM